MRAATLAVQPDVCSIQSTRLDYLHRLADHDLAFAVDHVKRKGLDDPPFTHFFFVAAERIP